VCPADIPLADQILEVRRREVERRGLPLAARAGLGVLARPATTGAAIKVGSILTRPFDRGGTSDSTTSSVPLPRSQRYRSAPRLPAAPARSRVEAVLGEVTPAAGALGTALAGSTVTLFLQCVADRVAPDIALDTARVLRRLGAEVVVPRAQHCCGLPAYDLGDWDGARRLARQTVEVLESTDGPIVTPASSCVAAVAHDYDRLFADDEPWAIRAQAVASRMHTLAGFLDTTGALDAARSPDTAGPGTGADDPDAAGPERVTVHRFCQSTNVLGAGAVVEQTIERATGDATTPLHECETCCGFGGSTSMLRPDVAAGVLARKLACVAETGAAVLVTDNPGCVLHLRGGVAAAGMDVDVRHLAEHLARVF
jgi:Fe-S oxidoreductase